MMRYVFWIPLVFALSCASFAAQLQQVGLTQQGNTTSLHLTLRGSFTHSVFVLHTPERLVLDLRDTHIAPKLTRMPVINGLIKQVRVGPKNARTLRLVFDLNQGVKVRSAPWYAKGVLQGITIDVIPTGSPQSQPLVKSTVAKNSPAKQKKPVATVKQPSTAPKIHKVAIKPQGPLRNVVVVLDAGHGGKDPGAKGPKRSREKDVVLAITLRLKQLIDRQPGMRAVLTRNGDYYVGLRERLAIARKYNGDVFVSIHADAFNNPHSNGASVFALSQSGATSEAARWIAQRENYSELGGVNLDDLDDQNGVVRSVLIDLSQTATINAGLQMGGEVLKQLNGLTSLHSYKVEQARFMVLKSPDIPSILVETGFISNPREEANLTSRAYQVRLTQAIFQGIKGYFWESPPQGTRIEAMVSHKSYG